MVTCLPHHRGVRTSAPLFPLVHIPPLAPNMCIFPTHFDIIKLATVSSNLLEQTKVLAWLSWMVNIISECVTAENVASSICPHAEGLSGTSTICLLAGKKKENTKLKHTHKKKHSALIEVNSFFTTTEISPYLLQNVRLTMRKSLMLPTLCPL